MASLLPPRSTRRHLDVELTATAPVDRERRPSVFAQLTGPRYGFLLVAGGGALVVALAGWVLVAGLCVVGWLSADTGGFGAALGVGTELWLLTNGAGAVLDTVPVTLIPLGVTLLWVVLLGRVARSAARVGRRLPPARATWLVAGTVAAAYAAALVAAVLLASGDGGLALRPGRALFAGVLLAAPVAWWQAARTTGYRPAAAWPDWARALPRAVGAGVGVLIVTGALALTVSLFGHLDRVEALWRALDAGLAGGVVLLVLQLALLPTAVVWSTAYTLGAGFTLGAGSLVTPRATDLGLLPSLPLAGALPVEGAGAPAALAWLSGGVLAAAVAALVVLSTLARRPTSIRIEFAALVGGLAGLLPGLLVVALAALASGSLGIGRLAHVGPALGVLAVIAPVLLGLTGMITGALAGLVPVVRARLLGSPTKRARVDRPDH